MLQVENKMPMSEKEFLKMVAEANCTTETTAKGHGIVYDEKGKFLSGYAVSHGKRTKRGEVPDSYVRNFKRALQVKREREA